MTICLNLQEFSYLKYLFFAALLPKLSSRLVPPPFGLPAIVPGLDSRLRWFFPHAPTLVSPSQCHLHETPNAHPDLHYRDLIAMGPHFSGCDLRGRPNSFARQRLEITSLSCSYRIRRLERDSTTARSANHNGVHRVGHWVPEVLHRADDKNTPPFYLRPVSSRKRGTCDQKKPGALV